MNAGEATITFLRDSHSMLQTVMNDVSREDLWRRPPGKTNRIGAIYCHAIGVEDLYIQQILQARPLIWEAGAWGEKLGHAATPNLWESEGSPEVDLDAFLPYRRAVYTASELYIASLSDGDFNGRKEFPGRDWSMSIAQLLALVVSHASAHSGEIAALKGVFGLTGLPY